jgi:hypothetical protein
VSGDVVNLREAARLTGWSVKTLRRRCVAGQLEGAQRVAYGSGQPEWVIPVGSLPTRQGSPAEQVSVQSSQVGAPTAQLGEGIAAMAAVITELSGRLSEAQGEIVRLTSEAAEARGQLLQLQAGQGSGLIDRLLGRRR